MIAPILRLVLIYLALIAAVVAVFNRDRLAGMFSDDAPRPAAAAEAPALPAAEPAPARMPTPTQPAPQPGAANGAAPLYGSDLQAPVAAAPAPQTAPQPAPQTAPSAPQPAPASADAAIAVAVNAARSAFWAGDIEGAKVQMLALSRAHPANADLMGELGNLHFALRDYPAAAEAWYRAGLLLLDQGQGPQRRGFIQALATIDPDKAADLAARAQGR